MTWIFLMCPRQAAMPSRMRQLWTLCYHAHAYAVLGTKPGPHMCYGSTQPFELHAQWWWILRKEWDFLPDFNMA